MSQRPDFALWRRIVTGRETHDAGRAIRDEARQTGGLWLVNADTPAQVERLVHDDPFWSAGLRKSVRVLVWKQVFADGARVGA